MSAALRLTLSGIGYAALGFVFAVVALFFFPILFGPAGAILGAVGRSKGDALGTWAIVAGVVATLLGFALAAWILTNR